jgi:hypothetical protein
MRMIGSQVGRGRCWCYSCRDPKSWRASERRRLKRRERQAWRGKPMVGDGNSLEKSRA